MGNNSNYQTYNYAMEKTYDPRRVIVFVTRLNMVTGTKNGKKVYGKGNPQRITGFAEDSFINIEELSNGITSKVGCDGEIIRAIDPSRQRRITLSVLQNSSANNFFNHAYGVDRAFGGADGLFAVEIKDLSGKVQFATTCAWTTKSTPVTFGRDSSGRQWVIDTADGLMNYE